MMVNLAIVMAKGFIVFLMALVVIPYDLLISKLGK